YPFTEQLKAMDCRWDPEAKAWYHFDKEAAARAQELVSKATGKHYVSEVPYQLNERVKQMGCRWDPEARSWYHSDRGVAEQA
ncbi:MAG: hypothetical protein DMG08_14660, partial [Acidobacteria bacterium]